MPGWSDAGETRHRVSGSSWAYRVTALVTPWAAFGAAVLGALPDDGLSWWVAPLLLPSAPVVWWVIRRMPHEVRASTDGLTLIASSRLVHIPWDELTAVTNPNNHPMWLK